MNNKDSERETITGFFQDDAFGIPGFLQRSAPPGEVLSFEKADAVSLPRMPEVPEAAEPERKGYWRTLRAFFRTGKGGGIPREQGRQPVFPALLAPFQGKEYTQYNFPCWVSDAGPVDKGKDAGPAFYTLQALLQRAVQAIAPQEGQAKILKDNLLRLEAAIRDKVSFADAAFKAAPVFEEALAELEAGLSVKGEEGKAFSEDLIRLKRALPPTGVLISFSPQAPLHLLATVIQRKLLASRRPVRAEIARLSNQLKDILAVEREKNPESHSAEHLHSALDFADTFLNFEELSSVLPSGGSEAMPEERHHRIELILETLGQAESLLFSRDAWLVAGEGQPILSEKDWKAGFPGIEVLRAPAGTLSATAAEIFEEEMGKAARAFAALRIGQLEVNNQYFPELHSDFFAHFDWRSFDEDEWAACAPVLLLSDADQLLEQEFNAFSRQLAAGLPVKYLVIKGQERDNRDSSGLAFRREPGALAIAHRNTFVLQSSVIRPAYLHGGFEKGLDSPSPALFYLLSAQPQPDCSTEPSLWASAAVEGREFPGFIFDSQKGPKWGSRFDIHENPQPEADWPGHQLAILDDKGKEAALEIPFTFADFAVLGGHFAAYFHIVPPEYWTDNLIPLADYLGLSDKDAYTKVPFIWVVDADSRLQRAAVAWPLVLACRERLDFWHYLQENAGVHSFHVEQATETLKQELREAAEKKIADLKASQEAAVEKAREEAARTAMERLASVLLDLDVDAVVPAGPKKPEAPAPKPKGQPEPATRPPEPPSKPEAGAAAAPKTPEKEEPAEEGLGEAWIETPLCTSCNECIDANKNIFQYNADKQAFVANPRGGPFADIVRAAEKCPVKIIHPGAPQNPGEDNLAEWVKRAERYQG